LEAIHRCRVKKHDGQGIRASPFAAAAAWVATAILLASAPVKSTIDNACRAYAFLKNQGRKHDA
jgi:hypothetical protein